MASGNGTSTLGPYYNNWQWFNVFQKENGDSANAETDKLKEYTSIKLIFIRAR